MILVAQLELHFQKNNPAAFPNQETMFSEVNFGMTCSGRHAALCELSV